MPKYAYGVVYVVEANDIEAADAKMEHVGYSELFEHISGPYKWDDSMRENVGAKVLKYDETGSGYLAWPIPRADA